MCVFDSCALVADKRGWFELDVLLNDCDCRT